MGQSSMAGRGMLPEFQTLIPDVLAFHYLDDSWGVAREPLHIDPPIRDAGIKGLSSYPMGTGLGLGASFARELLASGGVEGQIGLIPCAYGGSPLSRWERQPGLTDEWVGNAINIPGNGAEEAADGDLYARMIRRTRLALERSNCVLRGIYLKMPELSIKDAEKMSKLLLVLLNTQECSLEQGCCGTRERATPAT